MNLDVGAHSGRRTVVCWLEPETKGGEKAEGKGGVGNTTCYGCLNKIGDFLGGKSLILHLKKGGGGRLPFSSFFPETSTRSFKPCVSPQGGEGETG